MNVILYVALTANGMIANKSQAIQLHYKVIK